MDILILLLIAVLAVAISVFSSIIFAYKKSTYYRSTHIPYLKMRFDLGHFGEYLTYRELRTVEKSGAKFLFNCYLPKENGETTEVDLLLISKSGIYVFESKNYSGWIFGRENAKFWTQTLPAGRGKKAHKEQFLNPIFQNKLHLDVLRKILGDHIPLHSVIVFSERCVFKDLTISDDTAVVIHRSDVGEAILKIHERFQDTLRQEDVERIYQMLYAHTQVTEDVRQTHISNIQTKLEMEKKESISRLGKEQDQHPPVTTLSEGSKSSAASDLHCPRCGGILILHTATRGKQMGKKFYGCSNFPKCRYTQNVAEQGNLLQDDGKG